MLVVHSEDRRLNEGNRGDRQLMDMSSETHELIVRIDERVGVMKEDISDIKVRMDTKVDKVEYKNDCKTIEGKFKVLDSRILRVIIAVVGIGGGGGVIWELLK